MKIQRSIRVVGPLMLLVLLSRSSVAAAAPDTPAAPAGQTAGKITALLPTAHVIRGEGKKAVTTDAAKGQELIWQDLVRTDKGGRARITLDDQSILSLGSQAELRIVKHDAQAQQTTLEMTYGRIRAQVSTVTRDGGSFQVHTPTAVAGVIGTDFGTDASEPGITTFVCMSGIVQVGNADPSVPGTVPCTAGQTTTVKSGLPPSVPKPATQQQINQVITDTEPASISAFAPASALIGTTVDAVATGTHMAGLNGVTISGSGVQVSLGPNGNEASATAHLVIASTAQPGQRTVTFTKANGANTAAVFTVIAPPGLQGTDSASLKKRYTDILTTEQQAADASNASVKASLQQESDQGLQAIQQNNAKLSQSLATSQLSQQLAAIVANFNSTGSNRETQAVNTANAAVDQIVAAMESKIQDGTEPIANVTADLDKQFAPINQAFQAALNQIHTDLVALAAASIQSIDQLIANFQQTVTVALQQQSAPPSPKVDSDDRSVEMGSATSFDAGGSTALSGATIVSTTWTLCDPSYHPAQVGVVLPANAPACKAVPGFVASSGQFQLNTCGLDPADYIARVTVVDSNGKSSSMDAHLHVAPPTYDDPTTRIKNLASAYISLQSQQFLTFFDPVAYSGYTQLQENIRDTFLNLSSMQINVRVSQASLSCNDATVRADWDQSYTFKNDQSCANAAASSSCQKQVFTQHEQLTARMIRKPGEGWYIVDFQGDNGKVQGAAPGPQTTFAPASAGTVDLSVGNISFANPYIEGQSGELDVSITNIGTAPSAASTGNLIITVPDLPNVAFTPGSIPPIPASGTVTVPVKFTVPTEADLLGAHVVKVAISPPAVGDSDVANDSVTTTTPLSFFNNLVVGNIVASGQLVGGQSGTVNVSITNNGTAASVASGGALTLRSPDFQGLLSTVSVPSIPAGTTVAVALTLSVPNVPGIHSVTATLTPGSLSVAGANTVSTTSLSFTDNLVVGNIVASGTLVGGQSGTVNVSITNNGTAASAANGGMLTLTSPDFPGVLGTANVPSIAAGATTVIPIMFPVPNVLGAHSVTATLAPGSLSVNAANTANTTSLSFVDNLVVGNIVGSGALVGGQSGTVNVSIANNGSAASVAGVGTLTLTSPDFPGVLGTANVPSVPAGTTVAVALTLSVPNVPGTHSVTATLTPGSLSVNAANTASTTSLSFTDNLVVGNIVASGALVGGQSGTVNVSITNNGTAASAANGGTLTLTSPDFPGVLGTANVPSIPAGTTTVIPIAFLVPNVPGAHRVSVALTPSSLGINASNDAASTSLNFAAPVVTDFTLTNTLSLNGDLNVKLGGQGFFNVSLTEPQGVTPFSVPVAAGPTIPGVTYVLASPFAPGSTNPISVLANGSAPAGTSTLVSVTGTVNGVSHSATQSIRFYTASLENFSAGQPGSNQSQPIILPINGAAQPLSIRLSGNFYNPGGGAQLTFPAVTGLSITPSATTAAAGDVITLQISAVQGAALNQTIPLPILAQVPNMNPPVPETLIVFVRPTALPDLAVTGVSVAGRNFGANPLLSGEPVDFMVTVANKGPGASQGFERLHLSLNGVELTNSGVTVPQSIASGSSINVPVHVVAPDPVATGSSTIVARVDEDPVGDLDPTNDSLSIAAATSDWTLGTNTGSNGGNSDPNALVVAAGASNATFVQPVIAGSGDFLTPIAVLNGIVSSRITAAPSLNSFNSTRQQIGYTITASSTAAQGFYAAQLIARFVDGGRPTAQRQATVHIQVSNAGSPGDSVILTSSRNNACSSGCPAIQINGLLIENAGLTPTRSAGSTGTVDLHFTDSSSVVSNVTANGSFQSSILKAVPYGVAANVFFAAAQDATGAVSPGPAQVTVSATSIQTSAMNGGPTPEPVGPNQTMLQFNVGDLQLTSQPCFNLAPGAEGVLQLTFTPLSGFNVASISWSVASLPPGVVLNSVTPASSFSGGSYTPVSIDLSNTNPADIPTTQSLTLLGSISNSNSSATVAFAAAIQLHSGACTPGAVRNAMIEGGGPSGARGVWKRGSSAGGIARTNIARPTSASPADLRLVAGDVSYTPSLPKAGDTVQVRFRITNQGTSEARDVPVSLLINGAVVASDTFDVGAGKTALGGLQWTNAQLPRAPTATSAIVANLVIDPSHNAHAAVSSGKIAPLAHFSLAGGINAGGAPLATAPGGRQRALIQMAESACAGFRFSSGASGSCGASDVEIAFEDAASGRFSLASSRGISDLGMSYNGNANLGGLQFTNQLIALTGHSYAIQLDGGKVGVLTIRRISNPRQKSVTADKVFRGGASQRIAKGLGKTNGPVETGDVSGAATQNAVATVELLYDNPL